DAVYTAARASFSFCYDFHFVAIIDIPFVGKRCDLGESIMCSIRGTLRVSKRSLFPIAHIWRRASVHICAYCKRNGANAIVESST
uniref:Ovule protein n=1 Tax=Ascaris lumbricoides TaxID=6252 RepID=A0A0M3HP59_ASCLU